MKPLLPILLLFSLTASAGTRYTATISGSVNLTKTSTGHTLNSGDSCFFSGSVVDLNMDNSLDGVYLDFSACTFSHLKSGTLFQDVWEMTNCTIRGINGTQWYVNIRLHQTHGNKYVKLHVVNTGVNISDQPLFQWDWPYNSDMVYTGSLAQTYYNETLDSCYFDGFIDLSGVITAGGNWAGGSSGGVSNDNRSYLNSFTCHADTFQNVNSTSGANSVYAIAGTGFGCKMYNMVFKSIDGIGSANHSHNAAVLWYGSITMDASYIESSYASILRNYNARSTSLGGLYANDTSAVKNSLGKDFLSYSFAEGNRSTSDMGNRNSGNGFESNSFGVYYCTVDSTTTVSYGGTWHGRIADFVNEDTGKVIACAIFRGENNNKSSNFSSDSSAANGFLYADIGSATPHKTIANNFSARWNLNSVQDSTSYVPTSFSALRHRGTTHTDKFGNTGDDAGYANYVATGSAPGCTTNTSPTNGSTITTLVTATLTWDPEGTATGYDVFGPYLGGTPPGSPTYTTSATTLNVTGLTPSLVYRYYVRPTNGFGSASGCATSYTSFTTRSPKIIYVQRRQ